MNNNKTNVTGAKQLKENFIMGLKFRNNKSGLFLALRYYIKAY